MYAKIFSQIYDGTLCTSGPWEALVTFQQLLILADQDGSVDMTASAISRRTTIPLDIINRGIDALMQEDPESRTPTEGGRRIALLSDGRVWGWRIVNYKHYRQLKREEDRREYHRDYWSKRKAESTVSTPLNTTQQPQQTQPNQPIAYTEAEAKADKKDIEESHPVKAVPASTIQDCPHSEILKLWAEILPSSRQPVRWSASRQKLLKARWSEAKEYQSLEWWDGLFRHIKTSDFLMGRTSSSGRAPFFLSLDWLLESRNFLKVLEGAYDNREASYA